MFKFRFKYSFVSESNMSSTLVILRFHPGSIRSLRGRRRNDILWWPVQTDESLGKIDGQILPIRSWIKKSITTEKMVVKFGVSCHLRVASIRQQITIAKLHVKLVGAVQTLPRVREWKPCGNQLQGYLHTFLKDDVILSVRKRNCALGFGLGLAEYFFSQLFSSKCSRFNCKLHN